MLNRTAAGWRRLFAPDVAETRLLRTRPSAYSPGPGELDRLRLFCNTDEGLPSVVASKSPWRASDKGILPLCLEKYLELLDWTGRQVRSDKRGAIPDSLAPILDRLQIAREQWLDAIVYFDQWFGRIVGSCSAVSAAADRAGHAFRGARHCAQVFG